MFSLIQNALDAVESTVSPSLPTLDEFIYHWSHITDYFLDEHGQPRFGPDSLLLHESQQISTNQSTKVKSNRRTAQKSDFDASEICKPIQDTIIPKHLNEIMRMLLEEDAHQSVQEQLNIINTELSIGPLLEYVLQNRSIELLCTFAELDQPVGICLHVFKFTARLISDCKVNLLGHGSVLNAINRLIRMCCSAIAGPYEASQMEFLAIITLRLQTNRNQLLSCFARDNFPLIQALLSMLRSPDVQTATHASDMLLICVSILDDDQLARSTLTDVTALDVRISELLRDFYLQVVAVRQLPPSDIEEAMQSIVGSSASRTTSAANLELSRYSPQVRCFFVFLRWFCFFDMLIQRCSSSFLAKQLVSTFQIQLLHGLLQQNLFPPDLLCLTDTSSSIPVLNQTSLSSLHQVQLNTQMLLHLCRSINSDILLDAIWNFLFANISNRSVLINRCFAFIQASSKAEASEASFHHHTTSVGNALIDLRQSGDDSCQEQNINLQKSICVFTMQLFEELLNRPSRLIVNELLITPVLDRNYIDKNCIDKSYIDDLNEIEESFKLALSLDTEDSAAAQLLKLRADDQTGDGKAKDSARFSSLHYFIDLIPTELKSCTESEESGINSYISQVQKHFSYYLDVCADWNYPRITNTTLVNSTNFYEGDFLRMWFANLREINKLPYEVALQITSVISKIALIPHPHLNEYLLNPSLPICENVTTLFTVLHSVVDKLQVAVSGIKELKAKLSYTRHQMLGQQQALPSGDPINQSIPNSEFVPCVAISAAERPIFATLIIIEEMCKELAAISFVTKHYLI